MCFSATGSFVVGAALVPAGIYCLQAAARKSRKHVLLAMVPFGFALQQFCEGFVWVGIHRQDLALVAMASRAYLFFALAFWPFWIPLSFLFLETRPAVRRLLTALTIFGLVWTWLYAPIVLDPQVQVLGTVVHHSIHYDVEGVLGRTPIPTLLWKLEYLVAIVIPLVASIGREPGVRGRNVIGILAAVILTVSFGVSYVAFWYAFLSVWCFFAAILTFLLCVAFFQLPERGNENSPPPFDGAFPGTTC